jgi:ABC-type multidrug transport system ATPase subunit
MTTTQSMAALVGYCPQRGGLFLDLTALENAYYLGALVGLSEQDVRDSYAELTVELGLPPASTLVRSLTRGNQSLVSLACAMLRSPRCLVLDDVLAGLDVVRAQMVWEALVRRTRRDNVCVLVTSHRTEDAKHADRIGFMIDGGLIAEGSPTDLCVQYGRETVEEVFRDLCLKYGICIVNHNQLRCS